LFNTEMAKVCDQVFANSANIDLIILEGKTGPSVLFTDSDNKLTTSGSIADSYLNQITTANKVADSATSATVSNTANAIVKTDTPVANVNVSSVKQTTSDAFFIRGNSQTISNNTLTKFTTFTGTLILNRGSITRSSGDFTIGVAGSYAIVGHASPSNNQTGWRQFQIVLNGSTILAHTQIQTTEVGSSSNISSISCEAYLAVNDVITFWCAQTSGGNLSMNFRRVSLVRLH
jgi:hypothetical protein